MSELEIKNLQLENESLKQQAAQLREENKSLMACQCDGCAETLEDNDAYCQKCWAGLQTAHATLQRELEKATGQLDIITRENAGEPDDSLAVDFGGLGWENHPAIESTRTLRKAHTTLRGLVEKLPVRDGDLVVKETDVDLMKAYGVTEDGYFTGDTPLFDTKEEAEAYAALLSYRATLPREGGAQEVKE